MSLSMILSDKTIFHVRYSLPQKKVYTFVMPSTQNCGVQMESRVCATPNPVVSSEFWKSVVSLASEYLALT